MSVSIQSETSKDEIDTEDTELEDLVWNLMSRSGLLPQIQGQISKFIEDNGKAENVHIFPERADRKLLGLIFEYLQWVGMKQTNTVLLSESPVDIDLTTIKSSADLDYKPELCRLFEELIETEDRGSPTRSHNYSKDEFEDSRLTSASGRQSVNEADNENGREQEEEISTSASKVSELVPLTSPAVTGGSIIKNDEESKKNSVQSPPPVNTFRSFDKGDGSNDDLLMSFDSPASPTTKGFDFNRPNVTVRQRFDMPDPFSPLGKIHETPLSRTFTIPDAPSNDERHGGISSTNLFKASQDISSQEIEEKSGNQELENSKISNGGQNKSLEENVNAPKLKNSAKDTSQSQSPPDEDSTSDFMETLTIEENTQDVSIPSEEKGMSSCEHAVSLN